MALRLHDAQLACASNAHNVPLCLSHDPWRPLCSAPQALSPPALHQVADAHLCPATPMFTCTVCSQWISKSGCIVIPFYHLLVLVVRGKSRYCTSSTIQKKRQRMQYWNKLLDPFQNCSYKYLYPARGITSSFGVKKSTRRTCDTVYHVLVVLVPLQDRHEIFSVFVEILQTLRVDLGSVQ